MSNSVLYCYLMRFVHGYTQLLTRTSFVEAKYDVPNGSITGSESLSQAVQRIVLEQTGFVVDANSIQVIGAAPLPTVQYCHISVLPDLPDRFSYTSANVQSHGIAEFHYRWLPVDESLPAMLAESAAGGINSLANFEANETGVPKKRTGATKRDRVSDLLVHIWGNWPIPEWLRNLAVWVLEPKYLAGVVGLIFDEQDRVLLAYHTYRPEYPWAPPSGWMKRGEDPTQALEREVFEETGFRVWVGGAIAVGGDKQIRRLDLYYRCALLGGEFCPCAEVSDARLFSLDDLPEGMEPFHREVIAYAAKRSGAAIPPRASESE